MKEVLRKIFKTIFSDIRQTVVSIIIVFIIGWAGWSLLPFEITFDFVKQSVNIPTPLWATTSLVILCGLYTFLKSRRKNPQKSPNVEEELHEAFGVFWNSRYKLRCMRCKRPLKCASKTFDPSIFWCSSCDTKFALRDSNGNHLTEAEAIVRLKESSNGSKNQHIHPTVINNNSINDYAIFPLLNTSALKKHIASTASHCHYEGVMESVFLFEGTPNKYQIVVLGKDKKDFGKMKEYWDTDTETLFGDHFKEVYLKEPDYNFWKDWGIVVVGSLDDIPDDFITKKYKWHLYP